MLSLTMLPARQGDCLWIEYEASGSAHHLVIDGGPENANVLVGEVARRIAASPSSTLHVELLIVTHIDNDHIGGVLDLLEQLPAAVTFGDIWFNGYRHLFAKDRLGTDQSDRLSRILAEGRVPWNVAFAGGAITVPEQGALPRMELNKILGLTLLGPTRQALTRLAGEWDEAKTGLPDDEKIRFKQPDELVRSDAWPPDLPRLLSARFDADPGAPNASSIALLLDYGQTRILLAADATAAQLRASIVRLLAAEGGADRLTLDACKVSHHGSKKSTDRALLDLLRCERWLISTDGSYFGHPDAAAIARLITYGGPNPQLIFDSRKEFAERWTKADAPKRPPFRARLPDAEGRSVTLRFTPSANRRGSVTIS